ncbi:hypothetical protein PanWU01x14_323370 [Parasponia andersonii]|uniref:Uncharacterized protein n=1 Tax=Parasponia andersonii TaxID=3476 RepID=A0A2P5AKL2_PARAD|nr:hypothetical protein PanWU01x14_323370 [Parasponia andersonii]
MQAVTHTRKNLYPANCIVFVVSSFSDFSFCCSSSEGRRTLSTLLTDLSISLSLSKFCIGFSRSPIAVVFLIVVDSRCLQPKPSVNSALRSLFSGRGLRF